jgi:hypothetical protein
VAQKGVDACRCVARKLGKHPTHYGGDEPIRKLRQAWTSSDSIEGLGGEALAVVGIGRVVLECKTQHGVSTIALNEVWHVPGAGANLFAIRRGKGAQRMRVQRS